MYCMSGHVFLMHIRMFIYLLVQYVCVCTSAFMHIVADLPEVLVDSLVVHVNKEEDGSLYWYRAKVLSLLLEEKVEVKLVDYGNTDVVARSSLKVLPHKYYQLPQQAVHCCLRGLSEILESPEIFEKFLAYQDEESLTAKVMDR